MAENRFTRPLRATEHCRHYSYSITHLSSGRGPCCARGIDLSHPGSSQMCMPHGGLPRGGCSQREEYTAAEHAAWDAFYRGCVMRLSTTVAALPAPLRLESKGTITCPNCRGQLHYARWQGGAAIHCTTENCVEARFSIEAGADWPARLTEEADDV
jgi:hypothetical protein